jgi:hypothetical protein
MLLISLYIILTFRNIEEILAEKGEIVQKLEFKEQQPKNQENGGVESVESANIELVLDETTSKFIKK